MRKIVIAVVCAGLGLLIYVMAKGFGTNPREVPFMMAGKLAPDFTMKRLDTGEPVTLSSFAGKPIVINFWATWCGPCKQEHPVIEWGAKRWGKDVQFLGVVFEDNEENTKAFLAQNGWSITQLYDPKSTVAVDYAVAGVPETYFINRQGVIVSKYAEGPMDPETMTRKIAEILK